jgi:hypothetical protein
VVGVSTGGVIGLGLTLAGDKGMPKFTAEQITQIYLSEGAHVFQKNPEPVVDDVTGEPLYYKGELFSNLLKKHFGEARLKDALTPVLVTSLHWPTSSAFVFSSEEARVNPRLSDCPIWQAARASGAKQYGFSSSCAAFGEVKNPSEKCGFKDGGIERGTDGAEQPLLGSDPTYVAYLNARKMFPGEAVEIYSLGAGFPASPRAKQISDAAVYRLSPSLAPERQNETDTSAEQFNYVYQATERFSQGAQFQEAIARLKN